MCQGVRGEYDLLISISYLKQAGDPGSIVNQYWKTNGICNPGGNRLGYSATGGMMCCLISWHLNLILPSAEISSLNGKNVQDDVMALIFRYPQTNMAATVLSRMPIFIRVTITG